MAQCHNYRIKILGNLISSPLSIKRRSCISFPTNHLPATSPHSTLDWWYFHCSHTEFSLKPLLHHHHSFTAYPPALSRRHPVIYSCSLFRHWIRVSGLQPVVDEGSPPSRDTRRRSDPFSCTHKQWYVHICFGRFAFTASLKRTRQDVRNGSCVRQDHGRFFLIVRCDCSWWWLIIVCVWCGNWFGCKGLIGWRVIFEVLKVIN